MYYYYYYYYYYNKSAESQSQSQSPSPSQSQLPITITIIITITYHHHNHHYHHNHSYLSPSPSQSQSPITLFALKEDKPLCFYNYINSQCMSVALLIQHAMRMRRIILSSVTCLALPYFSTLLNKRDNFRKKKLYGAQNACFDFLYPFCLKHFSL